MTECILIQLADDLLRDHRPAHSEFQMERFIVGKQPTPYARYLQALREVSSRRNRLLDIGDDLELARFERVEIERDTHRGRREVRLRKHARTVRELQRAHSEAERELVQFVTLASRLKDRIGDLTDARRIELEAERWEAVARQRLAFDLLWNHRPSRETYELIAALPRDSREKVLSLRSQDQGRWLAIALEEDGSS